MDAEQIAGLLGRSLTGTETTNFQTYLSIAQTKVEDFICSPLTDSTEARTFKARDHYSTVWLPIYSTIVSVTVNGTVRTDYEKYQKNNMFGTWYNAIVFARPIRGTVVVTADWGFTTVPADLQLAIAKQFDIVSKNQAETDRVKRKTVEDFTVIFSDVTEEQSYIEKYGSTLQKYSCCNQTEVQGGFYRHPLYGDEYGNEVAGYGYIL